MKKLLSLIPIALLAACGPPWQIVRQANPDPFVGQHQWVVAPVRFDGLLVGNKPEATYLADKKPETQQSFQGDKQGMNDAFIGRMMAMQGNLRFQPSMQPQPGVVAVIPVVHKIETGSFNGFVNIPSEAYLTLNLVDQQGQIVDQIEMRTAVGADIYHPSSGQRLRQCAERLATLAVRYLNDRVGP